MSVYFIDAVEITPVIRNINFRGETEGTPFSSKAYIEEESNIERSNTGSTVDPKIKIFLPANTNINKGDFIRVTKLQGMTILSTTQIGRRRKVTLTFLVGAFKSSHIEVECASGF